MVRTSEQAELALEQAAWDLFFNDALLDFCDPNPDLCRDLALDKTIRALGQRPRSRLTRSEQVALGIRREVEQILKVNRRLGNFGLRSEKDVHFDQMMGVEDDSDYLSDIS